MAAVKCLSISTKESPERVEYPNSGKYLITGSKGFGRMHRAETDLDDWDGEP